LKILFLTDNYPPEVNAPSTRTHFHCREWVRAGADVTVVTCAPNFPAGKVFGGYRNRFYATEWMDGVRVVRVWTYMAPNTGFVRRTLDFLSFGIASFLAGLLQSFDVLVATSPQIFTGVSGLAVSTLKRKPWVLEVRDLWPESIVAVGAMRSGLAIRILERLEMALYHSSSMVVPVTAAFKRHLVSRGVRPEKITVITNGVDLDAFEGARGSRGWDPDAGRRFRVGYLGTHGLAHGLDLVLRTAELLGPANVEFVLVGDGAEKSRLVAETARRGIENIQFLDSIPRSLVPEVLADFDACLVPLRDLDAFLSVIPSKLFEAAGARRPVLLGVRGEARAIVERYQSGLPFEPDDEVSLASAIQMLQSEPKLYCRLQRGGDQLAAAFDRRPLAHAMLDSIATIPR
jgi:glycosyltransferase involved in cell wall biosynthesis